MDARYQEGRSRYQLDRLHLTVRYFGPRARTEDVDAARPLLDSWHQVNVRALVFVRGGGLLCADCELAEEGSAALKELAGEGEWRPHVTLLVESPWKPVDSTALILAKEAAAAA